MPISISGQAVQMFDHDRIGSTTGGFVFLTQAGKIGTFGELKSRIIVGEQEFPRDLQAMFHGRLMNIHDLSRQTGAAFIGLTSGRHTQISISQFTIRVSDGIVRCQRVKFGFEKFWYGHSDLYSLFMCIPALGVFR